MYIPMLMRTPTIMTPNGHRRKAGLVSVASGMM
jgi:hypothetical protein